MLSNRSNRTSKKHELIDREKVEKTLDQVANDAFALAEQINPLQNLSTSITKVVISYLLIPPEMKILVIDFFVRDDRRAMTFKSK